MCTTQQSSPSLGTSPHSSEYRRAAYGLRVILYTLAANLVLSAVKTIGGIVGQSQALIVDGIESLTDLVIGTLVLGGFHVASAPPDKTHPYGHGKAEAVIALCIGAVLVIASLTATGVAIAGLLHSGSPPAPWTLIVLIVVVVTKELLFRALFKTGVNLESIALESEAWHQRSDALTSASAGVGITLTIIGGPPLAIADDIAALAAAGVICFNAVRILRRAIAQLMDAAVEQNLLNAISRVAEKTEGVYRVEKCVARRSGPDILVDMHIEVDSAISVKEAHDISHHVKDNVISQVQGVRDVLVHIEPAEAKPATTNQANHNSPSPNC